MAQHNVTCLDCKLNWTATSNKPPTRCAPCQKVNERTLRRERETARKLQLGPVAPEKKTRTCLACGDEWRNAQGDRFRQFCYACRDVMNWCSVCKTAKPADLEHFYKSTQKLNGLTTVCQPCIRRKHAEATVRRPLMHREAKLRKNYGISHQDFIALLDFQGGGCAICGKTAEETGKKNLFVDHCHDSGKVRAILCHFCNVGLGNFRDDTALLSTAIEYLNKHSA